MFDRVVNTPLNCLITPSIYLLNVSHRNPRTMFEICSKLTIKTPERSHWRHSGVFIVNFKNIAHFVLVFLLLTLNHAIAGWEWSLHQQTNWSPLPCSKTIGLLLLRFILITGHIDHENIGEVIIYIGSIPLEKVQNVKFLDLFAHLYH